MKGRIPPEATGQQPEAVFQEEAKCRQKGRRFTGGGGLSQDGEDAWEKAVVREGENPQTELF